MTDQTHPAAPTAPHGSSADVTPRASGLALLLRAIPALVVGLIITFTADHSPALGLTMLGAYGLSSAVVLGGASVQMRAGDAHRPLYRGLALISGLFGALALVALTGLGAGLALLLLLLGGYAVLAGALELVWGIRHRSRSPLARDALVIGAATLALAIVLALVGDAISAVGFFGAYAVMLGIFLLIAGLSLPSTTSAKGSAAA